MTWSDRTVSLRIAIVMLWIVTALVAAMMALAGSAKFTRPEVWTGMFEDWGYPAWFAFVIGGAELEEQWGGDRLEGLDLQKGGRFHHFALPSNSPRNAGWRYFFLPHSSFQVWPSDKFVSLTPIDATRYFCHLARQHQLRQSVSRNLQSESID